MKDFLFRMPSRIRFGEGISKNIGNILKNEMGFKKVFLATDKGIIKAGIVAKIEDSLKEAGMDYVIYDDLIVDPTVEVIDATADVLRNSGADCVLAVGGGSPIDTAKVISILQTNEGSVRDYMFGGTKTVSRPGLPTFAIPTTAGTGSEMTTFSVISDTKNHSKVSVMSDYLIPQFAIIDPSLQLGMPPFITATTGMDALTHAVETYISNNSSPISDGFALHAIKMIFANLRTATSNGNNMEARSNMAVASTIAGCAFMNGGLGIVHGIAQTIGGVAHVAHGTANAILLPYCMQVNVVGNLEKFKNMAIAMGENVDGLSLRDAAQKAVDAIFSLANDLRVPTHLSEVGVTRDMFDEIVEGTMAYRQLAFNPVKINPDIIVEILESAF